MEITARKRRLWSDEEFDFLEKNIATMGVTEIARKFNRTNAAVRVMANRLDLKIFDTKISDEEKDQILERIESEKIEDIADSMHRDLDMVKAIVGYGYKAIDGDHEAADQYQIKKKLKTERQKIVNYFRFNQGKTVKDAMKCFRHLGFPQHEFKRLKERGDRAFNESIKYFRELESQKLREEQKLKMRQYKILGWA